VTGTVTTHFSFPFLSPNYVFTHRLIVFPLEDYSWFSCLKSQLHLTFIKFTSSTFGDNPTYSPSDSFETFPFPEVIIDLKDNNSFHSDQKRQLEVVGKNYYEFRDELMNYNQKGLTEIYNDFNNPFMQDPNIIEQRRLHNLLDKSVLDSYGWSYLHSNYGFGLNYLDIEEEQDIPSGLLKERVKEKNFFFNEVDEAIHFENEYRAFTRSRKKLKWHYRWPDDVRDNALSNLLDLNSMRHSDELAKGLHFRNKQTSKKDNFNSTSANKSFNENNQKGLRL